MNRVSCRLSKNISELLVKQIAHELKNMNLYNSIANYFEVMGINDLGKFFRHQAEGEKTHHQWIMDYLTDANYQFMYPQVEQNTISLNNPVDAFTASVQREIETTDSIYVIYEAALAEKDYMTVSWLLNGLVKEQSEEEDLAKTALDIMELNADIFIKAERILDLIEQ